MLVSGLDLLINELQAVFCGQFLELFTKDQGKFFSRFIEFARKATRAWMFLCGIFFLGGGVVGYFFWLFLSQFE